jgi:hypothetical protein
MTGCLTPSSCRVKREVLLRLVREAYRRSKNARRRARRSPPGPLRDECEALADAWLQAGRMFFREAELWK